MPTRYGCAVVIGKFLPPHAGHHYLVDTALAQTDELHVIVCDRADDPIPARLRAAWLRERHPTAQVRVIDDRYDENDTRVWATNTIAWLGRAPDAVFTSEDYGEAYARLMGSAHVMVDRARLTVPCSGTLVRADPFAAWDLLEPAVRAWYVKRIVVVGAESTGTTTLARYLAGHYRTIWVPEYGREYSERKQRLGDLTWRSDEFVAVAREQSQREDAAARVANKILICDTDAFATGLWHRRYVGTESDDVATIASARRATLYLLTGDEIPFVQDGLRDGEHIRHEMHRWFEAALARQAAPWRLIRGTPSERLEAAIQAIDEIGSRSRTVKAP